MQVEVSIAGEGDLFPWLVSQSRENLFPPLVSQSREKAYEVLLEFKFNYNFGTKLPSPDKVFYSPEIQNVFQCQLTSLVKK
jgi:hypothetical protein